MFLYLLISHSLIAVDEYGNRHVFVEIIMRSNLHGLKKMYLQLIQTYFNSNGYFLNKSIHFQMIELSSSDTNLDQIFD